MTDQIALATKCFNILSENVGPLEMEWFLHYIGSGKIDYTTWQRDYYDAILDEELREAAWKHEKEHPFQGKKAVRLTPVK